jgi:hypothetical protein
MDFIRKRPELSIAVAFIIGLFIGLVVLGWGLWPVQWTGAGPQDLAEADQALYLRTIADNYSRDLNATKVTDALSGWPGADAAVCRLALSSPDPAERARLEAVATVLNSQGCASIAPETEEEGGSLLPVLMLLVLLVILVVAILFVINRRNAMMSEETSRPSRYADLPAGGPVTAEDGVVTVPLARFQTTYTYGHDSYDDSFSIENANGDFLGECGVGISESIGTDSPKNVTAFEVWLFDKNDIRTVTKVIMSDHAFFDEALKAKLAPKGEPVLARENETIVLETASLIINADIKEMQYGSGVLPPQSFFERMTIELSAWSKEGDFAAPDVEGRVDEILNY